MNNRAQNFYLKIKEADPERADYIFRALLEFVCKKKFEKIFLEKFDINKDQEFELEELLSEHINKHKPLEYIIGKIKFLDLDLFLKPPMLIPRPETEEWVYNLIQDLKPLKDLKLNIVDVGTGSGCIGLSIAKAFPNFNVLLVDINDLALELAHLNAQANDLLNIRIVKSDLLKAVDKVDIVISNPPYISEHDYINLEPSVKDWEDEFALVAQDNGFKIIHNLIAEANSKISDIKIDAPRMVLEVGYNQAHEIKKFYHDKFNRIDIKIDFCSKDRVLYFYK